MYRVFSVLTLKEMSIHDLCDLCFTAAPPSTVSSSGDNLPIIKSLEEIRREQALVSMRKRGMSIKQVLFNKLLFYDLNMKLNSVV